MTARFAFHVAVHAGPVLAALLAVACEPAPAAPEDSVRFDPPGIYRLWYRQAEACRGLDGDYELLRFYRVPDSGNHLALGVRGAIGRWAQPHRIYVLEGYEHEMLHDLLSYLGDFTHNDSQAFRVCDLTDEGGPS
jgi:hypothetical protein